MRQDMMRKLMMVNAIAESTPTANAEAPAITVEVVYNHIYFYSDVTPERCLDLMKKIREQDAYLRSERISRSIPAKHPLTPIWLHIHSAGGDAFCGLNLADQIKTIESPVYSIAEGYCASAATLISMACAKRYIRPNSFMLVHEFSTMLWGKHEEFKDEMRFQAMLIKKLVEFYSKHSKLDAERITEMLTHDYWMDADEALTNGFVDDILMD